MSWKRAQVVSLICSIALVTACKEKSKPPTQGEKMDEAKDRWAIDSARLEAEKVVAAAPVELAGSTWRLVKLQSMDDKVYTPETAAVYTVEFGTDGRVHVVGGCNRGSGTWTATPPTGLTFGPLATTRAMCPPGSMSARFLGDFQYMRSYVIVDGKLFISLMADGGIYEFAPEEQVTVTPDATGIVPVIFACADSTGKRSRIMAKFTAGNPGKVSLERGGKTIVVPQVASASGAKYEGKGVMFWNKGRDAMVTWLGTSHKCSSTKA